MVHMEIYLQVFLCCFSFYVLRLFNEETMIAALFKFHNNVQEASRAASGAFGKSFVISC